MERIHVALTLTCLLFSFPLVLNEAKASDDATLYVDPPLVEDIGVGETFVINLSIADVVALYAWQIKIFFTPTLLNCTGAWYPSDHVFAGKNMVPVVPVINNDEGHITHGASLMGVSSFTGNGTLCQIEFEVLSTGSTGLDFSQPYGEDTFLLDDMLDEIPAITINGFFANVPTPSHDVAVTTLSLSDDRPVQNDTVTITVKVLNNGTVSETFNVSVFYGSNLIETETLTSLNSGVETTLTFDWDTTGVPVGSHTVKAEADVVQGETKIANNVKTVAVVVVSPTIGSTDINGDGIVNIRDVGEAAKAYGADVGSPRWNPAADINGDGIINLFDIALVAHDFGTQSV